MVGGIFANSTRLCDFYEVNTQINTNVLLAARKTGVKRIHAMGTGCAYPKRLEGQLLEEKDFLDGLPEPTNYAYAYAKRNMLVHLMAMHDQHAMPYTCLIPANLYGPHDNFHPKYSHVVPGLLVRFLKAVEEGAKEVEIWGTARPCGLPLRRRSGRGDSLPRRAIPTPWACTTSPPAVSTRSGRWPRPSRRSRASPPAHLQHQVSRRPVLAPSCPRSGWNSLGWKSRFTLEDGIRRTIEWCRQNPEKWKTAG